MIYFQPLCMCAVGFQRHLASSFILLLPFRTFTYSSAIWRSQSLFSAGIECCVCVLRIGGFILRVYLASSASYISVALCYGCSMVVAMAWDEQAHSALCTWLLMRSTKVTASCSCRSWSADWDVSAGRWFSTRNSSSSAMMPFSAMHRMYWWDVSKQCVLMFDDQDLSQLWDNTIFISRLRLSSSHSILLMLLKWCIG